MSPVRRSLAFSSAGKHGGYALGCAATVIFVQLLTPNHFGIFAVGKAVVALIDVSHNFGVANYLEILDTVAPGALLALASAAGRLAAMPVRDLGPDLPVAGLLVAAPVSAVATCLLLRARRRLLHSEIESLVARLLRRRSRAA